jgi:hypothetical protein
MARLRGSATLEPVPGHMATIIDNVLMRTRVCDGWAGDWLGWARRLTPISETSQLMLPAAANMRRGPDSVLQQKACFLGQMVR